MPILKPPTCEGCPFYNKSKYITPDTIVESSTISILAQNPGDQEENGIQRVDMHYGKEHVVKVRPQPLIGATGHWLKTEFWPLTQIPYESVSKHNVIKCRPYNTNDLPDIANNKPSNGITVRELKGAIEHCTTRHLRFPDTTTHIMLMGEISLYALTGENLLNYKKHFEEDKETGEKNKKKSTITEWRGWVLGYDRKGETIHGLWDYYHPTTTPGIINLFPVVHLASLFRNDLYYHATLLDFIRFGRLVKGEWPEKLPAIRINEIPERIPSVIGFDTEYRELEPGEGTQLTMWSMADVERNVYVVDAHYTKKLTHLPERVTIVTQNGGVDIPHLLPLVPDDYASHVHVEDCMFAHALLWTGEMNSLDYQLSKVGRYNRHKHLRESHDPYLKYMYAGLDADSTLNAAWRHLHREFQKDQLSWVEYTKRRRPLLDIVGKFNPRGIEVWTERVDDVVDLFDQRLARIIQQSQEITENPFFNIASNDQVKLALEKGIYKIEKEKPKKVKLPKSRKKMTAQEALHQIQMRFDNAGN